jgi:hypothetical protein
VINTPDNVVVSEVAAPALTETNPPVANTWEKEKIVVELAWMTSLLTTRLLSPTVAPEAQKDTHTAMEPAVVLHITNSLIIAEVAAGTV